MANLIPYEDLVKTMVVDEVGKQLRAQKPTFPSTNTDLRDAEIVLIVFTVINSVAIIAAVLFYLWQKQKVANTQPSPVDEEKVAEAKTVGGKRAVKPPSSVTEEGEEVGEDGIEDESEDEDEDEDRLQVQDDFDRLYPH